MRPSRKDHLLEAAVRLFTERGFNAVGIDTLLEEAGVAKGTLYNHFATKNDLILEAIRITGERWMEWLKRRVDQSARPSCDPTARILAIFDALDEWFKTEDFRGCTFIRAAGEFPLLNDPIHQIAAEQKNHVHRFILDLVKQLDRSGAEALSRQLMLLIEGAIVTAQMHGPAGAARHAKAAAKVLLAA